ncbi:rRNA methyltransferase [Streptomyces armeniacus]|uniref:rRNA methyltransferase n=1 Tax=Streptomyces armeniacus TaxID=83291 RepID=A0A345XWB2_9ACTN|nr:small ribosomal subunit Rsm22 family protein [Streptomyces armeniacus]AXK35928.1 rRNA methyltransferase [Streptomyces armeniacus]
MDHVRHPAAAAAPARAVDQQLRAALDALLDGLPPRQAAAAVERLIGHYRGDTPTGAPVLRDRADVVAYAAYRMPATFEAAASALDAFAVRVPGWRPASHLDIGGGTGAAVWAAARVWGDGADGPARKTTVLDWAAPALDLGRELAAASDSAALRAAEWRPRRLTNGGADADADRADADRADLVTVSYVLGELTDADRRAVVAGAAGTGRAVVVVEPGTPDGYLRVRAARDVLTGAGLTVLAPCPHSDRCPITPGEDWCHFAARVSRSSLHRQVKGGSLAYEDEKFSYVAAVRPAAVRPDTGAPGEPAASRVVRKPQLRKGQVLLDLCTAGDGLRRVTVSKRQGPVYRAARDTGWGAEWPPPQP